MLSFSILIPVVYWSFLDNRIRNKKAILAFLEPAYKVAFYTVLCCVAISTVLLLVIIFATTVEDAAVELIMQLLFIAYLTFLIALKTFISCLKSSVKKEEKEQDT